MKHCLCTAALVLAFSSPCFGQWAITGVESKPMEKQTSRDSRELWLEVTIRNKSEETLYVQGIKPDWYMVEAFIQHKEDAVWDRQNVGVDRELEMLPVEPGQDIKILRRESESDIGASMMLTFLMSHSKQDSGSRVLLGPFQLPALGEKQSNVELPVTANVDAKPDFGDFDEFVTRVMKEWQVPGVAIAVIHEDQIVLAKGYGYRDLEKQLPVTEKTLFSIASISKPFTATAAAILVDDGKLHWNDRVREHLRTFRLHNEKAADQLTIRDCLSHQTGLPIAALRWYGANGWPEEHMTPEIAYRTLRYVEPSAPARSHYYYSNSGYLIVGQMIAKYGESWEGFLQDRLLDPLKMERTNFSVAQSQADPDHAKPYDLLDGNIVRRPFFPGEVVAPAAGINSNVEEMVRFLRLYLGRGELDGERIVSNGRMKELLTPEVAMPEFNFYGSTDGFHRMGWQVIMIDGEKWVRHTGGIPGFTSVASFCPKRKCGCVVLTNLANRPIGVLIKNNIRSRLLGRVPTDQFELFRKMEAKDQAHVEELHAERRSPRIKDTTPAHPLSDYVGTFSNPAYGDFVVSLHEGSLRWQHHGFQGSLRHYHYNVFDMEADQDLLGMLDGRLFNELVTFHDDVSGTVNSLSFSRSMPTETRFTRVTTDDK